MKWEKGMAIKPIVVRLTPELVQLYAQVSGDRNRLHLDEDFARTTRYGTRIAHGMLLMASVTQMLVEAFGPAWAGNGHLDVSFIAPAPLGSTLQTGGQITEVEKLPTGCRITFEAWAAINSGQKVLTANGSVKLKK